MNLTNSCFIAYYYGKKKSRRVGRPPGGHSNLEGGVKRRGRRRKRRKQLFVHKKRRSSASVDNTPAGSPQVTRATRCRSLKPLVKILLFCIFNLIQMCPFLNIITKKCKWKDKTIFLRIVYMLNIRDLISDQSRILTISTIYHNVLLLVLSVFNPDVQCSLRFLDRTENESDMFKVTAQQEPSSSICSNVVIKMWNAQSGETFGQSKCHCH